MDVQEAVHDEEKKKKGSNVGSIFLTHSNGDLHTETEATDQIFHLNPLQSTDTRPTSPRTNPIMPVIWKSVH